MNLLNSDDKKTLSAFHISTYINKIALISSYRFMISLLFRRYNVYWYAVHTRIQKLILFLIKRNTKPFNLKVVGIFVASIECFASVKIDTHCTLLYV